MDQRLDQQTLDELEAERIKSLTDAQLRREMRILGKSSRSASRRGYAVVEGALFGQDV